MLAGIRPSPCFLEGRFDEREIGRCLQHPAISHPHIVGNRRVQLPEGTHLHAVVGRQTAGAITVVRGDGSDQPGAAAEQFIEVPPHISLHRCSASPR